MDGIMKGKILPIICFDFLAGLRNTFLPLALYHFQIAVSCCFSGLDYAGFFLRCYAARPITQFRNLGRKFIFGTCRIFSKYWQQTSKSFGLRLIWHTAWASRTIHKNGAKMIPYKAAKISAILHHCSFILLCCTCYASLASKPDWLTGGTHSQVNYEFWMNCISVSIIISPEVSTINSCLRPFSMAKK